MADEIDLCNLAWEEGLKRAPIRLIECIEEALKPAGQITNPLLVSETAERSQAGIRLCFERRMNTYRKRRQSSPLEWSIVDSERLLLSDSRLRHVPAVRNFLLNGLTTVEFERLCAGILARAGCTHSTTTPEGRDEGIDVTALYEPAIESADPFPLNLRVLAGPKAVILAQCKRFGKHQVGVEKIREFIGSATILLRTLNERGGERVRERLKAIQTKSFSPLVLVYFTTSYYTVPAISLADQLGMVLVDGEGLAQSILFSDVLSPVGNDLPPSELPKIRLLMATD